MNEEVTQKQPAASRAEIDQQPSASTSPINQLPSASEAALDKQTPSSQTSVDQQTSFSITPDLVRPFPKAGFRKAAANRGKKLHPV